MGELPINRVNLVLRDRKTVFVNLHKYEFFYSSNDLFSPYVTDNAGDCKGGTAIIYGLHSDFNDIALSCCRETIDLGHTSGDDAIAFELAGRKDKSLFVNPFEASTTD